MDEYIVPADSAPRRLDAFLSHALPAGSRRRAQELIAHDAVRVNGRRLAKGGILQAGDVVQIRGLVQDVSTVLLPNPELQITVCYEDADVVVVDKPAGVPSHALRMEETETVANFLIARFSDVAGIGSDPREPGLVHRLDTDTSGVLLVARTHAAHRALREQFVARSIVKEYVAVVMGDVAHAAEIASPIAHDRRRPRRMQVCSTVESAAALRARPALTRFRPLERFGEATLLAVEIPTGVMHQIRVHLAAVGHPIVGDTLYGGSGMARQLLHARRITFTHPRSGERLAVEAALPADLQTYCAGVRRAHRARERARG